jgi:anti-anti-sigma factor
MALEADVRDVNGVTVIRCRGRLVFGYDAISFRENVKALLTSNPRIVLHLEEVVDLDSGGMGILVGLLTSAHAQGSDVRLSAPSRKVTEVLRTTKLHTVFDIFPNSDAAVASYGSEAEAASSAR